MQRKVSEMTLRGGLIALLYFFSLPAVAADSLSFNKDIRAILSENCFSCHGLDEAQRKASLRLDLPERAYAEIDGIRPIVPGHPDQSELVRRILSDDPDEHMPPAKSKKTLTSAQKDMLQRWIKEGAKYERHWSLEPPKKPNLPGVLESNIIDTLISARLAQEKLALQPEASRATLIRRAAFTLTGLPPTLEEVDRFESDSSPNAYSAMLDRYLASPRYGEEMARHWLDLARYGDTHGLHLDNEREMWAYRDWVVDAMNENLPFDQFTLWQLAGDLLPDPTPQQLTATGFLRCNVTTSEGGAIDEEYRHLYAVDRAATLTTTWLGITGACAQCHDHKFDPLSIKEFYSLYAFFYSSADPAMDGNIARTAPSLALPAPGQQEALDKAKKEVATYVTALETTPLPAYEEPKADAPMVARTQVLLDEQFPVGAVLRNSTRNPAIWLDHPAFGVPSGHRALELVGGQFVYQTVTPELIPVTLPNKNARIEISVRLDPASPPRWIGVVMNGRRAWWGDEEALGVTTGASENIGMGTLPKSGKWVKLSLDPAQMKLAPGARIGSVAVQLVGGRAAWDHFVVTGDLSPAKDPLMSFALWWKGEAGKKPADLPPDLLETLQQGPEKVKSPEKRQKLLAWYLRNVSEISELIVAARKNLESARVVASAAEAAMPSTLIYRDLPEPRDTFVALRGDYTKLGDKVEPDLPRGLGPFKTPSPARRLQRTDLARWLVEPDHPLTARVIVNRFWQQVFGTGIVATSHDFGTAGEAPSHPELLDWLALTFMEKGWDVKWLMKEMMLSRAFRQESRVDARLLALDPGNRLLGRAPRLRLDAEQIRDNALFVSGLIDLTQGGRGVHPYQPPNIWEPVGYGDSNTRNYLQDHGSALYRRSLYTFLKRTAPPPFMTNFDAPSREQTCTRRERNDTPMQALQLLNDVQHLEAARALAERTLAEKSADDQSRLRWMFRTVLSRQPDSQEATLLQEALAHQRDHAETHPEVSQKLVSVGESPSRKIAPAAEVAAWTMMANLVLNLDETVTRN